MLTKVICRDDACQNNKNNICTLEEIELVMDSGELVCIDYVTKYKKSGV